MGRFRQGWELTKKSWAVLREHPELFRFPVFGFLAVLVVLVVVVAPGLYLLDISEEIPGGILVALGLYLTAFVGFYFSVGLAAAADAIFHGRQATLSDGLAVSRSRLGAIAGWAALSTAIGGLSTALSAAGKGGEAIVGQLLQGAWSLITFLAVPVIAIEGTGPFATLKRSAGLFRSRWQGQVTGHAAIGGIIGLAGVLPALLLIGLGIWLWASDGNGDELAAGAAITGIGLVLLTISLFLIRTLNGVFGVALYRYAADGEATGAFSQAELESAVKSR